MFLEYWGFCASVRAFPGREGVGRLSLSPSGAQPERRPGARLSTQRSNTMAMTKDQLISDIAEATDASKATVRAVLEQLSEIVSDALENYDEITLPGIGKLKVTDRPARTGRNPQTGKAIEIAAKKVVKYVPAKALTDAIN
ncbi:HU family DNA-binding protein [Pseudomonas sp. 2FG]|uniref:HU family DNA-binding protein n=1 Tax=Pseudomonas sp. 2FG TaxID=2502191 RepID=UPI002115A9B2|nr:HU family DNA-binding protein [Pseudomonas sp. 2FG]